MGQFVRLAGDGVPAAAAAAARAGVLAGEEIAITKTLAAFLVTTNVSFAGFKLPRTAAAHKANAHPEKDQNNDDQRATGNEKSLLAAGHSVPHALAQMEQKDAKAIDDCPKSHDEETDAKTALSAVES